MPAKRFNEADIDFDAEQQAKGVTVGQMQEVLNAGGIDITERSLRTFLDKGALPGKKVAAAARAMVSEEGKDPF